MIPSRTLLPEHRLTPSGRLQRGNVVHLWGGRYEVRMRRPHEGERFALPARVIRLPDLTACTHDEVRDMARRAFRAERAELRTTMMRDRTNSLCKGAA